MNIPKELPIIYPTKILIPGFSLKLQFHVEDSSNLLNYIIEDGKHLKKLHNMIGIVPKSDYGKIENVIGTVGIVQSVIQIGSIPEEFFLIVQGTCRFKLGETILEEPVKINKINLIENFKELFGCEKEKLELTVEFQKAFIDFLKYSELGLQNPFKIESIETFIKSIPLYKGVDYCLKNYINLTLVDAYEILRANDLNCLLKIVIDLLKRETFKINELSKHKQTGLLPITPNITSFMQVNGAKMGIKKKLSPEMKVLQDAIKNANMPMPVNDVIMEEFKRLQGIYSSSPDYSILINYISYVVNLPWNKSTIETLDLKKAKSVLISNHYGLNKVKKRILEFIAVKILNPEQRGRILCFIGPPGVGKTTIAKAIADSLNRSFKRISLGGINMFSDIKGHRKTYIGAMPGCIIQAVNQTQSNNPVILLDEVDKMCKGLNGDPAAALLEVLDPEQNSSFVDSYVGLPFDLSQVMFISTANNANTIPATLRDRMEIIYLEGYTMEEKIEIAKNFLIPKILKDYKINEGQITISQNTIKSIIQNYAVEAGVRELQRKLEAICDYIAVEIVENFNKEVKNYVITPESLLNIFGDEQFSSKNTLIEALKNYNQIGIAIGLSWTPVGGKVQVIETSRSYPKNKIDNFILTGLAGRTLKESVKIGLNWIDSFVNENKLDMNIFDVHVHLPEGGLKKDGPSAGITIVCALISLFWQIPLKPMIAMTGEISLQGCVLPVGGVKTKILAAYNSDIRTVIIPQPNLKDTNALPKYVRENLNIFPVSHIKEVLDIVVPGGTEFLCSATSKIILTKTKL